MYKNCDQILLLKKSPKNSNTGAASALIFVHASNKVATFFFEWSYMEPLTYAWSGVYQVEKQRCAIQLC